MHGPPPSTRDARTASFPHQTGTGEPRVGSYRLLEPPTPCQIDSPEFRQSMQASANRLREANVGAIVLMHGSFVGDDPFGVAAWFDCVAPQRANQFRAATKRSIDRLLHNNSNFDAAYRDVVAEALKAESPPPIQVERYCWSGENNHIGRADAAVRLVEWLGQLQLPTGSRVLFVSHSHGGNALALFTQLCGATRRLAAADAQQQAACRAPLETFFNATRAYWQDAGQQPIRDDTWQQVREQLLAGRVPLDEHPLDIVTLGMPLRYGWDPDGYEQLLHINNHHSRAKRSPHRAALPGSPWAVIQGRDGDYVQQIGVAGTDFPPVPGLSRANDSQHQLGKLLAPPNNWYDVSRALRRGTRVPDAGRTLLVPYPRDPSHRLGHVFGHGVYTRYCWLSYQFEQIVGSLYA